MAMSTTDPNDATIHVEVQPMGPPRPIGYVVRVAGKVVAALAPEAVETAYRKFQELAMERSKAMDLFR